MKNNHNTQTIEQFIKNLHYFNKIVNQNKHDREYVCFNSKYDKIT